MNKAVHIDSREAGKECLKSKINNLILQIKEHCMPKAERERLAICEEELKECDDPAELNIWVNHFQSELNYYQKKEQEETFAYRNYPCDNYDCDGNYYQKV